MVELANGTKIPAVPVLTQAEKDSEHETQVIGLIAVLCACFSSGFAGVFFEMLVKTGSQPSVVIRNLQLGIFSLFFAAFAVLYADFDAIVEHGFFQGYNPLVFVIIVLQVLVNFLRSPGAKRQIFLFFRLLEES